MFEKIGSMFSKEEAPEEEVLDQVKETGKLKEKADMDENAGDTYTETKFEKGDVKIEKNFVPSDEEIQYREAKEKLEQMKSSVSNDEALAMYEELEDKYNDLISERKAIIDKIQGSENGQMDELRSQLAKQNKRIITFEKEQLEI